MISPVCSRDGQLRRPTIDLRHDVSALLQESLEFAIEDATTNAWRPLVQYPLRSPDCREKLLFGREAGFGIDVSVIGVRCWIYDPYNRPPTHNDYVRKMLQARGADLAFCSNVLNVVREPAVRQEILTNIAALTQDETPVYFTVYEGDRSSRGKRTKKGWQANRPLKGYVREIRKNGNYEDVRVTQGKFITATRVRRGNRRHGNSEQ